MDESLHSYIIFLSKKQERWLIVHKDGSLSKLSALSGISIEYFLLEPYYYINKSLYNFIVILARKR